MCLNVVDQRFNLRFLTLGRQSKGEGTSS